MSLLDQATDNTGRQWEHTQEGDAVGGVVISNTPFDGGKYEPARMLKIDCSEIIEGGQEQDPAIVTVLCGRTVLKRWVEENQPAAGDTVVIKYMGLKKGKDAKPGDEPYNNYWFYIKRGSLVDAASDGDW